MPLSSTYKLSADISFTNLEDDMVLLDLNRGTYFGLNSIGAEIVRGLMQKKTGAEVGQMLAERYQKDVAEVESDTLELLMELVQQNLIVESDGTR